MSRLIKIVSFLILFFIIEYAAYSQDRTWFFPRTSIYTWDTFNTKKYYRVTGAREDMKSLTMCSISKSRFVMGSYLYINYERMTQQISKKPFLGVKTVLMRGYASIIDPSIRQMLKMGSTVNHEVSLTMYLNEDMYPTVMLFSFGKNYYTLCMFQNEELAQHYWLN